MNEEEIEAGATTLAQTTIFSREICRLVLVDIGDLESARFFIQLCVTFGKHPLDALEAIQDLPGGKITVSPKMMPVPPQSDLPAPWFPTMEPPRNS